MKKNFVFIFISLVFFTACNNNVNFPSMPKENKNELIQKANAGDISAIKKLDKIYLFAQTKQGVEYFEKWQKMILLSDNSEEILSFAKIYKKHFKLFINGRKKQIQLLQRAYELGNEEAFKMMVNFYIKSYGSYKKEDEFTLKILNSNDFNKIYSLFNQYILNEKALTSRNLEQKMNLKNMEKTIYNEYLKMLYSYYDKKKKDEFEKSYENILNSDNYELIKLSANFLRFKKEKSLKLLKRAVLLNDKDVQIYISLAKLYGSLKQEENMIKNLKKASSLDDYKSTYKLLGIYLRDKKYEKDYLDLKEKLKNQNEAKRALANFLYSHVNKAEAIKLLEELLQNQNQNENALIDLATLEQKRSSYYDISEFQISQKYQNKILKSEKPYLLFKLRKKILKDYSLKRKYKKLLEDLNTYFLNEKNIYILRELINTSSYKNTKEINLKYRQKAVLWGDTWSSLSLASYYFYTKDENKIKKALLIYEDLANKGEEDAIEILAQFYLEPQFRLKKLASLKDIEKSARYYEKLLALGEDRINENLVYIYLCGGKCYKKTKIYNQKKADFYMEKIIKQKNTKVLDNVAWRYYTGTVIKKDLKRALYYYEALAKMDVNPRLYGRVGYIYFKDFKDNKKALEYFKYGAKKGSPEAKSWLGYFYYSGIEVPKDKNKAKQYFIDSQELSYSSFYLGKIYQNENQYEKAKKYYKNVLKHKKAAYTKEAKEQLELLEKMEEK